jgi:hypothetical protein
MNVTGVGLKNKDCNQVVLGSYMIAVFVFKMARSSCFVPIIRRPLAGPNGTIVLRYGPAGGLQITSTKEGLRAIIYFKIGARSASFSASHAAISSTIWRMPIFGSQPVSAVTLVLSVT